MEKEILKYSCGETVCKGWLVHNEIVKEPRPAILIAPAWRGLDNFAKNKAEELARLGYVAFAADIYGGGKHVDSDEEAAKLMQPLFCNRALLRERICGAYETLIKQRLVDKKRVGAIGFCFGGLTVIELLRSGTPVRGVASFHGVLGNSLGDLQAELAPNAEKIKGSLLILHGADDPLVSSGDIAQIQQEFNAAKVDWQMNIYGHTVHAFTNPDVRDPTKGLAFNEKANHRSWIAMKNFFDEVMA